MSFALCSQGGVGVKGEQRPAGPTEGGGEICAVDPKDLRQSKESLKISELFTLVTDILCSVTSVFQALLFPVFEFFPTHHPYLALVSFNTKSVTYSIWKVERGWFFSDALPSECSLNPNS